MKMLILIQNQHPRYVFAMKDSSLTLILKSATLVIHHVKLVMDLQATVINFNNFFIYIL